MTQFSSMGMRMKAALFFFFAVFAYLAWHLYTVQIGRHDELFAKAKEKYTAVKSRNGQRGEIFDFSGNLLAGNIPYGIISVDPTTVAGDPGKRKKQAAFLAKELNLDEGEVYKLISVKRRIVKNKNGSLEIRPKQYALLKKDIPFEEFEKNRENIKKANIKGIIFTNAFKRHYPKGEMLANILGFTNLDRERIVPVVGLEKSYSEKMDSVTGKVKYERARDGAELSFGRISSKSEQDGANIYLTIREPLQAILEEELDKLMKEHNPKAAYAIMAEPFTGDILAVAQRPTFNPNEREKMNPSTWRNRIAEDVIEPGSIMKPFAVAGAIDYGVVTPDTRFDCERGRWFYAGKLLRDSHPIGVVSVSDIICQSSNIGTAKIALALGAPRLDKTLRSFGFGSKTGIAVKPETKGIFRPLEKWDSLSITRFPIGQGIAVSPFQIVKGYCMLANGGHPVKLRLVDRVKRSDSERIEKIPAGTAKSIYRDPSTHFKMINMMKRVTEPGGTAAIAAIRGFNVAGKTGTAQKFINGAYSHEKYTASFVGFVPADSPKIVLLVSTDEPTGKDKYGGSVSGPYFKSIAERTLQYMHVIPDIEPKRYDEERKAASKRVLDEKKKLWAKEAKEREERKRRSEANARGRNSGKNSSARR